MVAELLMIDTASPIHAYNVVQTGANSLSGGVHDGNWIRRYHPPCFVPLTTNGTGAAPKMTCNKTNPTVVHVIGILLLLLNNKVVGTACSDVEEEEEEDDGDVGTIDDDVDLGFRGRQIVVDCFDNDTIVEGEVPIVGDDDDDGMMLLCRWKEEGTVEENP